MAHKIQKPIGFTPDQVNWIDAEADHEETSFAEIVRRAVRSYRRSRADS